MKFQQQLVAHQKATFTGMNRKESITIHETANVSIGADAEAHANLQLKGFSSSWHWQVDDRVAIQSFPHHVQCWHAGDGRGKGNAHSIAIEICVNVDGDYVQAVRNAAQLTRKIMQEEGISHNQVFQHNHWRGKNCPYFLRQGREGLNWASFKEMIQQEQSTLALRLGDFGAHVKKLQQDFNKIHFNLIVDGSFGNRTAQAVRFFQAMHQLEVDGSVGSRTTARLKQAQTDFTKLPIRTLTYRQKNKAVEQLQQSLKELNYSLAIDHSFGPETYRTVKQFQQDVKLVTDGMVGPLTWKALKYQRFK